MTFRVFKANDDSEAELGDDIRLNPLKNFIYKERNDYAGY